MKKSTQLIVLFLVLVINQNVEAQTGFYVPQLANFDTAMLNLLHQYGVPGGQLAITYHGRLVYDRGYGYADSSAHTPVCPGNVFRLASVSKPITSITLMHLYEQGRVQLDDTVFGAKGILNDTMYQDIIDPLVYQITVRELLTHSGGWNRNISGDPMFDAYAIAQTMFVAPPANAVTVIRYVLSHQLLDFAPGTQYQYSNFGYCILGRVIEKITGQNYEKYVRDSILAPLHITDMRSGFNLSIDKLPGEVNYYDYPGAPYAYSVYDNVTLVPWPYGGFNIEAMDSHGGWVASAQDLCRLLVAVDRFSTKPDILLPATIDTMVHPSSAYANYALGWAVNSNNNWWHAGSLPGTTTEIVRANTELNWAILLNTRPYDSGPIAASVDNLVWNVLPTITSWPTDNLFDSTYDCSITSVQDADKSLSFPRRAGLYQNYPNPFNPSTINRYQLPVESKVTLRVFNLLGQEVKTLVNRIQDAGYESVAFDAGVLAAGVYFYRLETTGVKDPSKVLMEVKMMMLVK